LIKGNKLIPKTAALNKRLLKNLVVIMKTVAMSVTVTYIFFRIRLIFYIDSIFTCFVTVNG